MLLYQNRRLTTLHKYFFSPLSPISPCLLVVLQVAVNFTASYARSSQRCGISGSPSLLSPALPAFLPPVPAARLSARLGVHIRRELLLLLQPLLGSCLRCYSLLLCNVLYPGFYGSETSPPGTKDSWEGELCILLVQHPSTGRDCNRC